MTEQFNYDDVSHYTLEDPAYGRRARFQGALVNAA